MTHDQMSAFLGNLKITMKVSYRCMDNVGYIIKKHNNNVLNTCSCGQDKGCNCRSKQACLLSNNCLSSSLCTVSKWKKHHRPNQRHIQTTIYTTLSILPHSSLRKRTHPVPEEEEHCLFYQLVNSLQNLHLPWQLKNMQPVPR